VFYFFLKKKRAVLAFVWPDGLKVQQRRAPRLPQDVPKRGVLKANWRG